MILRECRYDDWEFLLNLRNDRTTRNFSVNQEELDTETHKEWIRESLKNNNRTILIAEIDKVVVGMIREDRYLDNPNEIILSWAVSPNSRGNGYGNKMLQLVTENRVETFYAKIKSSNIRSIKMALRNKFEIVKKPPSPDKLDLYKKRGFFEIISEIEEVRKNNNVNWMDILRLGFRYAPHEARLLVSKVGESDKEISKLLSELSIDKKGEINENI